ncbi:MAG: CRISPR-associated helicase Cas3' [Candidatus Njordarchaeia archaeon]
MTRLLRLYQRKAIETFDNLLSENNGFILLLELPTGYGKTFLSSFFSKYIGKEFDRLIHVAPTRVLVEGIYHGISANLKLFNSEFSDDVRIQMMHNSYDPFFLNRILITTYTTYSINALRIPVSEVEKAAQEKHVHYDLPVGSILNSIIIFDEIHLPFLNSLTKQKSSENSLKPFLFLFSLTLEYCRLGVPFIYMSATMPSGLINFLKELTEEYTCPLKVISYKRDPEFEKTAGSADIQTFCIKIKENNLDTIVSNVEDSKNKLGLIVNTVSRAIELYDLLREKYSDKKILLLHSRFKEVDKQNLLKKLKDANIVISTQVIEVGVDISFDVLISEISPPASLIQRAGRLKRWGKNDDIGRFFIVEFEDSYEKTPYEPQLLVKTRDYLRALIKKSKEKRPIDWKYAIPRQNYTIGTKAFLDSIYSLPSNFYRVIQAKLLSKNQLIRDVLQPTIDLTYVRDLGREFNFNYIYDDIQIPLIPTEDLKEQIEIDESELLTVSKKLFLRNANKIVFSDKSNIYLYIRKSVKGRQYYNLSSVKNSWFPDFLEKNFGIVVIPISQRYYDTKRGLIL